MRDRNSSVLARSSSSESFCISGSRALIAATRGSRRLTSRSFLVPKTLPSKVLIKTEILQGTLVPDVSKSLAHSMRERWRRTDNRKYRAQVHGMLIVDILREAKDRFI